MLLISAHIGSHSSVRRGTSRTKFSLDRLLYSSNLWGAWYILRYFSEDIGLLYILRIAMLLLFSATLGGGVPLA